MRTTLSLAAAVLLAAASRAAASGACCSVIVTPNEEKTALNAAAFVTDARSTEGFGSLGDYVFDQTAASAKVGFRVFRRLSAGVLAGRILRSKLRNGEEERTGGSGYLYGLQLGAPVWADAEREFEVSLMGSWSRAEGKLNKKRRLGIDLGADQRVQIEEFQASVVASKCLGPLDVNGGIRWFNGHTEVKDQAGSDHLAGHRDGHFSALVGTRIHLGSDRRSLALELGLGSVRTLTAGLLFSF